MKKLEKMIRDRLTWDDRIDASQIEISVDHGVATLKGCVSNYPEKILAEIETQMLSEIKSVVNEITIKFPSTYEIPSDPDLREALFCLLDANSEIKSNNVKVSVNSGNIVLKGTVNSYWKSNKIKEITSKISGVKSITNKISIIPDEKISDGEIANIILLSMQNCVHIDENKINMKVENGVVSISGTLSSMSEYEAVNDIVKSTRGVIDINNNLKWILRYYTT